MGNSASEASSSQSSQGPTTVSLSTPKRTGSLGRLRRRIRRKRGKGALSSGDELSDSETSLTPSSVSLSGGGGMNPSTGQPYELIRSYTLPASLDSFRDRRSQSAYAAYMNSPSVNGKKKKNKAKALNAYGYDTNTIGKNAYRKTDIDIYESLIRFENQLKLKNGIFLHITSFARPLDQLHLVLVCKQFRYLIYHKKLIPGLKTLKSIQYFHEKYGVYYDERRKSFKFNLSDSLDVPLNCRLKTKMDKKRLILFLIFQNKMTSIRFRRKLSETDKELVEKFEDTFASLQRLEVAWFTYGKENPLGWLESVLISPYTSITMLDFSESQLNKSKVDGLIAAFNVRLTVSPLTVINFTGNHGIDDDVMKSFMICVSQKLPYLKTLYLDYTSVSDGTCEAFKFLYQTCTFVNDRKSLASGLGMHLVKEGTTRLRRISMEGSKVNMAGIKALNEIYSQELVNKADAVSFYVKINWSGAKAEEFKNSCDERIKFY